MAAPSRVMATAEGIRLKKFSGLEVCRFLCATSVLLWHYQHFFATGIDSVTPEYRSKFPLYIFLSVFYNYGLYSVQIFWAISGYIFFWKYEERISNHTMSSSEFFVLRFSRLYPLHFITLFTVAIMQYVYVSNHKTPFIYEYNDVYHFVMQLGMASNWLGSQPYTFNGPIWSISAEVVVYSFFFLAIYFIRPTFSSTTLLCVSITSLSLLIFRYGGQQPIIYCIYFFFSGGIIYNLLGFISNKWIKPIFIASIIVLVTILILIGKSHHITMPYTMTISIISTCVIIIFILIEDVVNIDLSRISYVGNLTYSSYLIHFPIQLLFVLLADALGLHRELFLSPIILVLFLVTTFCTALTVYRFFELPAQKLIRAFWRSPQQRERNAKYSCKPLF
jgi:peptidoglycan/LPS O-acetylase OafA/YrhL